MADHLHRDQIFCAMALQAMQQTGDLTRSTAEQNRFLSLQFFPADFKRISQIALHVLGAQHRLELIRIFCFHMAA